MTNDLISREAALEILMRYCPDDDGSCSKADVDPREMLDEIESLPAVDAAPVVHGRWEAYGDMPGFLRCSECKDVYIYEEWFKTGKWSFCPNCGARMDKED